MREAAKADNVNLRLASGFRTMETALRLRKCYEDGKRLVADGKSRRGACNNGNLAATPGWSKHQIGVAVDIRGTCSYKTPFAECARKSEVFSWLQENANKYKFYSTVRSEPWHWEHKP